jgi:hypothetical protein
MIIKSIKMKNFRCFQDCRINFDDRLTVLTGINGSGKSAVLDAVSILFRSFLGQPRNNRIKSRPYEIKTGDLPIGSSEGRVGVSYELFFNDEIYSVKYNGHFDLTPFMFTVDLPTIQFFDLFSKYCIKKRNITNIFVSYGDARFLKKQASSPPEGSAGSRNNTGPQKMASLKAFWRFIDNFNSESWFEALEAEEARKKAELQNWDWEIPELTAVRLAVTKALSSGGEKYENFRLAGRPAGLQPGEFQPAEFQPAEFQIDNKTDGKTYKADQLSAGFQAMLSLALDLSGRLAAFNARFKFKKAEDYLKIPAIIVIDEIEQHLHPSWQQSVLPELLEIFPGTQFIVTTHSPQVLTSVKNSQIRILDGGSAYCPETYTYGARSSDVLREVMGVSLRPDNEIVRKIDEYLALIKNGAGLTSRALELRGQLEELIPGDTFLADADLLLSGFEVSPDSG